MGHGLRLEMLFDCDPVTDSYKVGVSRPDTIRSSHKSLWAFIKYLLGYAQNPGNLASGTGERGNGRGEAGPYSPGGSCGRLGYFRMPVVGPPHLGSAQRDLSLSVP